jgi:type I restriction enzyme R subunit
MKKEKNTMRKFGGLIHQYTIKDAVNDKAIVPLIYEGKMVEQSINKDGIDYRIERILKTLNDRQGADLKRKWANYNKMASSNSRLDFIAYDIYEHFVGQFRKNSSDFKAMLATDSKAQAITYLRKFEEINRISITKLNVAVMVSAPDTREGHDAVDAKSNTIVLDHWQRMMNKYDNKDQYESKIKNAFKTGDLDLLIVVDKLLTGFDAPRAVVLYIDKKLKEHSLLQAIARVNRLYTGKDYGFIIDYKGLLEPLNEAMDMYSGAGLEAFDPKDIKGALIDIEKVILDLRNNYSNLKDFFSVIKNNKDMEAYEQYLEPKGLRDDFYELLSLFSRDLKTALGSLKILEVLKDDEINKYKERFAFYQNLRGAVKLRYSDSIDFKEYEDQMKNLLDTYVNATGIMEIVEPANIMNVDAFEKELNSMDSKKAKADMIKTRMAKSIQDIRTSDPARFAKFSELLEEAYRVYKEKRIKEGKQISIDAYLKEMQKIKEDYQRGREVKDYPSEIRNNMNAQVVYDLIENFKTEMENEEDIEFNDYAFNVFKKVTAIEIDQVILSKRKPEWHKNEDNINAIEFEIVDRIRDYTNKHDLDISFDNIQKLSNEVVKSARERYRVE